MKEHAMVWQGKRDRLRKTIGVAATVLLAVVATVVWQLIMGEQVRWMAMGIAVGVGIAVIVFNTMAYTNTMLVAMYFAAVAKLEEKPEEMDLYTGAVETVNRVEMPYIGLMYQITLVQGAEKVRLYCPGRLMTDVEKGKRVRVLAHEVFVAKVSLLGEGVGVEREGESTRSA